MTTSNTRPPDELPPLTGNPAIDPWIAEGRLLPQARPGTVLDLHPLPELPEAAPSLTDAIIEERDRELDIE